MTHEERRIEKFAKMAREWISVHHKEITQKELLRIKYVIHGAGTGDEANAEAEGNN